MVNVCNTWQWSVWDIGGDCVRRKFRGALEMLFVWCTFATPRGGEEGEGPISEKFSFRFNLLDMIQYI